MQIRNALRAHVACLINEVSKTKEDNVIDLVKIKKGLNDKITVLKTFDDKILGIIDKGDIKQYCQKLKLPSIYPMK